MAALPVECARSLASRLQAGRSSASCARGIRASVRQQAPAPPRGPTMSTPTTDFASRYSTHLNILHAAGELIDVNTLVAANQHPWWNQTLCQVNESVVRLGVVQGEYHWHQHEKEDEFFYVVSGQLLIDLEDRCLDLTAGKGVVIPKGVMHRPRAPERTVILMVERAGIVPTGTPA